MTRFAIIDTDKVEILEYIRAVDPCLAFKIAKDLYPNIKITVCYADECGCL